MLKLFGGLLIIVVGLAIAIISYYFAWASSTPGFPNDAYHEYQIYSMLFGGFSIGVILGGAYMLVSSIKKMNREYKESELRNKRSRE